MKGDCEESRVVLSPSSSHSFLGKIKIKPMTKKLLITSNVHQLCACGRNARGNANVRDFVRAYSLSYAERFEEHGWTVHMTTGEKVHQDCEKYAVDMYETKWRDYDRVILMYFSADFPGGQVKPATTNFLLQGKYRGLEDVDVWIFHDDNANPPTNTAYAYWRRTVESQSIKQFVSKKDQEKYGYLLDKDQVPGNAEYLLEWTRTPGNIKMLIPGGRLTWRTCDTSVYGFPAESKVMEDPLATYIAGRKLAYGWETANAPAPGDMDCDMIYAGTPRKDRINILSPLFLDPDIHSRTHLRKDRFLQDIDPTPWVNHDDFPVFETADSPYIHSKTWVCPIVGDKWQKGSHVSSRFWLQLALPTVNAIHTSFDPDKVLIKNPALRNRIYWETAEDFKALLEKTKSDPAFRAETIELQRAEKPVDNAALYI
jgi:hypothetical protein